ncbi:hypothetical protein ABKV19_013324, partial [Rosa sericea]
MELKRCLKHVYAISIFMVALLHTSASLSLGRHDANNNVTKCITREREALLAIKQDLVDKYNRLSLWGSGGAESQSQDCCRWEGVYCDNHTGHVLQLDLGIDFWQYGHEFIWAWQDIEFIDFRPLQAFIGSLTNLRYLDLCGAEFCGLIPYQLGNLTHLEYLSLTQSCSSDGVENLNWLPHHSSLKYLDLSGTNLSKVFDWLEIVNKLPNQRNLTLHRCDLPPPILSLPNISKSLVSVDLSYNPAISSSIFKWLCNYNTTLVHLDLSFTNLSLIPDAFRNMRSLAYLNLIESGLSGPINPDVFRNMSSLAFLDLSFNKLSGPIPEAFRNMRSLAYLDLFGSGLSGPIPD